MEEAFNQIVEVEMWKLIVAIALAWILGYISKSD